MLREIGYAVRQHSVIVVVQYVPNNKKNHCTVVALSKFFLRVETNA